MIVLQEGDSSLLAGATCVPKKAILDVDYITTTQLILILIVRTSQ